MKKAIGKFIRKIIPSNIYRIIRDKPLIIPSYYKEIINDLEKIIEMQRSGLYSNDTDINCINLRKNAHILDKGLQRKDAKPGHSKEIYKQAIGYAKNIKNHTNDDSINWCFEKIKGYEKLQSGEFHSFENYQIENGNYEELIKVIKNRRSSRIYNDKKIDIELIKKIFETINWASSSCNKQPIKVFITQKDNVIKECLKQCKGATGFGTNVPCFVSICVDMKGYVLPSEIYLPMIDASLGVQNSVLTAHTFGISTTILSWAQKDKVEERNLRNLLTIPEDYGIIFNMTMGYPDFNAPIPMRKSIESTINII